MRIGKLLALLLFAVLLLPAAAAVHAQCAGFSDVALGGFCNNVTWMKNRQVTLGCEDGTVYCPNQSVTRLQMALFMNRVGNTLTPDVVTIQDSGGSLDISTPAPVHVCESAVIPAVPYARTMLGQVTLTYTIAAAQVVQVGIATSVNGGAYPFPPTTFSKTGAGQHQHHFINRLATLPPNQTHRFAVFVARVGSAPVPIGAWRCNLQLHVVNAAE
jgi:hypothetical protein